MLLSLISVAKVGSSSKGDHACDRGDDGQNYDSEEDDGSSVDQVDTQVHNQDKDGHEDEGFDLRHSKSLFPLQSTACNGNLTCVSKPNWSCRLNVV